jgi:hypothetical protein
VSKSRNHAITANNVCPKHHHSNASTPSHFSLFIPKLYNQVAATLALLFPEMIESVAILDIAPVSYSGQNGAASSKIWDDIHSIVTGLDNMPVETLKDKKEADKWLAQVRLMSQMPSACTFK